MFSKKGTWCPFSFIGPATRNLTCIWCWINTNMVNSQIIAKEKRVAEYNLNPNNCTHCHSILNYSKRYLKFCNHSCSATHINLNKSNDKRKHQKKNCLTCNKITANAKFCSKSCGGDYKRKYKTEEEQKHARRMRGREATARYAAKKRNQTPSWADLDAIKLFYLNCPLGYEVDHIIPISKGGLHSMENLQYLTISENRKKWCKIVVPLTGI